MSSRGSAQETPSSSLTRGKKSGSSRMLNLDSAGTDASTPLLQRSRSTQASRQVSQRRSRWCRLLIPLILLAALISFFHPSLPWSSTPSRDDSPTSLLPNATLTNGTHAFHRTVILISLDGAKPSYLTPGLAPHLQSLGTSTPRSRRAEYMQPIFPTLTFPNHWSLLTGLYASSHGIVANDFTDVGTGKQFYYTSPAQSWDSKWWKGEPIWATAERSGVSSAVLMWPGPPVTESGVHPRYFQKYEGDWNLNARLNKVLEWIDMDSVQERPSLICAYVPDIDQAAHKYGPQSEQALEAVIKVDALIGSLQQQLQKRSLQDVVDVVVVSDHGMTTTSNDKLIYLDDLLGRDLYAKLQHRDGWPSAGLRFRGSTEDQQQLVERALHRLTSVKWKQGWKVYTRNDLPSRYHLDSPTVKDRLAPLWIIPELGWSITTHQEMATFADGVYSPRGNHGYDNREPNMHAIFVASGPSFSLSSEKVGKKGWNMKGFANIEVHNLISRILGIREAKRAPTNGTWTFWDPHLRDGL